IMLEFLSKQSNAILRTFVSLLRLTEIQDILHQFSLLDTKTLFGLPHIPSFLHSQIISRLSTDPTMKYTTPALKDGFPLLINPMVDIEHNGNHIEASVFLTIPEVPNLNAFCTIEYLTPIKYQSKNVCYSGPVTKLDLALISCPDSKYIISSETLKKCYQDTTAFICPSNVLTLATNISWLGFPFRPDSKFIFPRHHVMATDCSNLHPVINLGGRSFLATTSTTLQLSSGPAQTSPLAIYHIPCNVSFVGMTTGLGYCPNQLSVSVPLSSATSLEFIPWVAAANNLSTLSLNHPTFDIPEPEVLNNTVINDLDSTLATLDGQFTVSEAATDQHLSNLQAASTIYDNGYWAYIALALSLVNSLCIITACYLSHRHHGEHESTTLCRCGRPRLQGAAGDPAAL
ncbi:hypothetical protein ACROYT_G020234, partial [Oculina patagonica]